MKEKHAEDERRETKDERRKTRDESKRPRSKVVACTPLNEKGSDRQTLAYATTESTWQKRKPPAGQEVRKDTGYRVVQSGPRRPVMLAKGDKATRRRRRSARGGFLLRTA